MAFRAHGLLPWVLDDDLMETGILPCAADDGFAPAVECSYV
jgi:hypothetical protein